MKKLFLLLPVLLAMFVTSCLKDDVNNETIVLLGTESDVKSINDIIPDTLLKFLADPGSIDDHNLVLPEGNNPPNIQGEYVCMVDQVFSNTSGSQPLDSLCFRFGGEPDFSSFWTVNDTLLKDDMLLLGLDTLIIQNDTVLVDTLYHYPEGQHNRLVPCEIYGDVMEKGNRYNIKNADGFVMGKGDDFTAYFVVDYDCEQGSVFSLERGYIVTWKYKKVKEGNKTIKGIYDVWVACVNIESTYSGPTDMKDWIYVYRIRSVKKSRWSQKV